MLHSNYLHYMFDCLIGFINMCLSIIQLAELWPNGVMDNHGIKRAICRAKERKRAQNEKNKVWWSLSIYVSAELWMSTRVTYYGLLTFYFYYLLIAYLTVDRNILSVQSADNVVFFLCTYIAECMQKLFLVGDVGLKTIWYLFVNGISTLVHACGSCLFDTW